MNNRRRYFLNPLIFIVFVCASTHVAYSQPTTGKIEGQIIDTSGRPVAHEVVTLTIVDKGQAKSHVRVRGAITQPSDDQGNYTISNVPPGSYLVSFGLENKYTAIALSDAVKHYLYTQTFHPGTADIAKATVVEVAPGGTVTGIDITAEPIKTFRIDGRVIDEQTGAPISKVSFHITFQDSDGEKSGLASTYFASTYWDSDARGQFKIPFMLPGHATITPLPSAANNAYGDPIELDITDKDITGLEIKMHRGSTLSGQVVIDPTHGTPNIGRLSQIKYSASLVLMQGGNGSALKADIQPDGTFRFTGVFPGVFGVSIDPTAPGALLEFYLMKVERDGQELRKGVEIGKGEDLTGLRLIVRSTGATGGIIRGQVKIEGGELDGVHLYVTYHRTGESYKSGSAMLDARGQFVIDGLQYGEYECMIGPTSLTVSNEAGSKTVQRMPTVKQTVKVTAESESVVTLIMKLRPQ